MWQRYHGQNVIANVVQPRQSTPAVHFLGAFDEIDLCEKAVEEKIALKPHMFFHAYVYFPKTMPMQPGPKQGTRSAEENIAYQKRLAVGKRGCVQKWRVCEERERERGRRHSVRYMHVLYSHTLTCLAPPLPHPPRYSDAEEAERIQRESGPRHPFASLCYAIQGTGDLADDRFAMSSEPAKRSALTWELRDDHREEVISAKRVAPLRRRRFPAPSGSNLARSNSGTRTARRVRVPPTLDPRCSPNLLSL